MVGRAGCGMALAHLAGLEVRVAGTAVDFVSGVGGYYPSRRPGGPGDIKQQTADALDIMKALLERAGSSMADLLQVQVALVDSAENWEAMNEVYNSRVPEPRPVRSYFGSTGFGTAGQLLQIDAIAYVD